MSFLDKAAQSAVENVAAWRDRFGDDTKGARISRPLFLDGENGCGVIAEVKLKSPSRGNLVGDTDYLALPGIYQSAGAEAVSVVVEERYFGGSPELFIKVRERTGLPLLWKDFVVDTFQIELAAHLGASAILLIAALLEGNDLGLMIDKVRAAGLRSLVEVHDEDELNRALDSGADLVGVNNRDLVTLKVDLGLSEKLAPQLKGLAQGVAESGMREPGDVTRMTELGYRAVLVGEAFVTSPDPLKSLTDMVSAGRGE
ncbi:indole-3-glycerol-phosphate synthase [bacterium]|nr:MAG: indole-3-glycerol-phosphate synthase [bacterium]